MQFMMLIKHAENQGPPPQELMDAISALRDEAIAAGTIRGNGGLAPTAQSTRVRVANGQIAVMDGPFTETKEVVGGFAEFEFETKEAAVKSAIHFMELHKKHWPGWEGEVEVRQMFTQPTCQPVANERANEMTGKAAG